MLFFIWPSNNLMLSVPLYTIFEMQDIYQSSRKIRKSLLLNNSDFCTDYWVLWSIIKAGLLYIHYSVKFRSYYSSAMLLQPSKILIYVQQNTDNFFAVLQFNIMTFYHKGLCSVLNGVMYLCCGPCNASTPSDGRFDRHCLSSWLNVTTIGSLRSNAIPINPTEAIQASEGPQWHFSQWKKYIFSENWLGLEKCYMQYI